MTTRNVVRVTSEALGVIDKCVWDSACAKQNALWALVIKLHATLRNCKSECRHVRGGAVKELMSGEGRAHVCTIRVQSRNKLYWTQVFSPRTSFKILSVNRYVLCMLTTTISSCNSCLFNPDFCRHAAMCLQYWDYMYAREECGHNSPQTYFQHLEMKQLHAAGHHTRIATFLIEG